MIRWAVAFALCALLTSGCGNRHRPVVRSSQPDPGPEATSRVESPEPPGRTTNREQPVGPFGGASAMSHRWEGGREVSLGRMRLTAPESWQRKRPAVNFILAEFSLPRVEGDAADGRLTVSLMGGSVEGNVDRWRGQFGGKPQKESLDRVEIAGIEVTLADFSGTYVDERGPFAPVVQRPDYRLLGAIIPLEGQLYFVKCYGPQKSMAERADEFHAFVRSLRLGASPR